MLFQAIKEKGTAYINDTQDTQKTKEYRST